MPRSVLSDRWDVEAQIALADANSHAPPDKISQNASNNRREPQLTCRNASRGVSAGFYAMAVENLLNLRSTYVFQIADIPGFTVPFASRRSSAISSTRSTPGFGCRNGFLTAGALVSGSRILNASPILYF